MPLMSRNSPSRASADAARVLARAAYVTLYSGANFDQPEVDYYLIPFLKNTPLATALIYESINNELGRRMDIDLASLTPEGGFRIRRRIGACVINSSKFTMVGLPNNFEPNFQT